VRFSTHYYVLSLSLKSSALFEAFRDSLIEVENHGFPVDGPREPGVAEPGRRRELARAVDGCFGHYYAHEPLRVVLVGAPEMQDAFKAVTAHDPAVIGRIEGDHATTSARDLGQIVWPVMKEAMSGVLDRAMHDLEELAGRGRLASGLEAVVVAAGREARATLLVEDDYHLRGGIRGAIGPPALTPNVDVRDAIDDAVDAVIEQVLESAGNVVFTPPGTLRDQGQIALLLRDTEGS
jgi:hypothetical protein